MNWGGGGGFCGTALVDFWDLGDDFLDDLVLEDCVCFSAPEEPSEGPARRSRSSKRLLSFLPVIMISLGLYAQTPDDSKHIR